MRLNILYGMLKLYKEREEERERERERGILSGKLSKRLLYLKVFSPRWTLVNYSMHSGQSIITHVKIDIII